MRDFQDKQPILIR